MTPQEALGLVLDAADEWAGEYGFAMPKHATEVMEAVNMIEKDMASWVFR